MANYFTVNYGYATDSRYDLCDHVKMGDACWDLKEMDSFGPVSGYYCCNNCKEAADAKEAEQDTVCHDCHQTVKTKDTINWKWYDFYAPQGDEPLVICTACKSLEVHRQRVRKNLEAYEQEINRYDY